jgi:hypothetical protein
MEPVRVNRKRGHNKGIANRGRELRREQALARQASRDLRTPGEQLALLEARPGAAARERSRLA